MKVKTFILTFLMMMSSPFLFGQHWEDPGNTGYQNTMNILAQINLDDVLQEGVFEVAAFYGDKLLGVSETTNVNGTPYHVHLMVQGDNTLQGINFRFYNGEKEFVSSTEINFTIDSQGSHSNYFKINFKSVAQIEGTEYDVVYPSLQEAYNDAAEDQTITLLNDITLSEIFVIAKSITLDGNGKTLTYTGNGAAARAIDVPSTDGVELDVTIKNLTVDCNASYCQRGINYNDDGKFTLDNVTVKGVNVTYAVNLPGSADDAEITIKNSDIAGNIALNVWGENSVVNVENTTLTAVDNSAAEGYATVKLNNDGTTSAEGTVINITGGKIDVTGSAAEDTEAASNGTSTGEINISESTVVNGRIATLVAVIRYADGNSYSFETLPAAIEFAKAGDVVSLIRDITASDIITINKSITLDGNGKKLTSTAGRAINVSGADGVTIKNLTINASGERAINVIQNATNVTIDNVTATAANYTVNLAGSAANAVVAVKNSDLTGLNVVNVAAAGAQVTVDKTVLNCDDNSDDEKYAALALNKDAQGGSIIATEVTFNIAGDSRKATNQAENGTVTIDGSTEGVEVQVAYISYGNTWYGFATIEAAIAKANDGETIEIIRDITSADKITVTKSITINGNGKTLTYTGNGAAARAIDVPSTDGVELDVTIKNLTVDCTSSYCQRGINYNDDGKLTLEGVTVKGTNVTYALNLPGSSDNCEVAINNSSLTGNIALNVWGANAEINATGSHFTSVDNATHENYAAVKLNNNGTDSAEGAVITITGGSITAKDENGEPSFATTNATATGEINISVTTQVTGNIGTTVAIVIYEGASEFYGCSTLQDAIDKAGDDNRATVKLLRNVETSELIKVEKAVVIDLNGKTVTANCKKAFEVYANATIKNGKIWSQQRCVDTRKNVELTLADVTLEAPTYYSTHQNQQPLTVGGSVDGTEIVMTNVNINAGTTGYAIISFVQTNLTATNSNISGYSALYVKEGSEESEFNFVGSTLKGDIGSNDVEGNSFATIATEANNVTVTLDANSELEAVGQNQFAMVLRAGNNNITVAGAIAAINFLSDNVNNNTIKVKAEYADELLAEGYVTTEADANGLVKVSGPAIAKIGETYYASLQDAFNAATEDQTVTIINDVELENTVTVAAGKTVTLDLNGKTINTAWEDESAEKHYYAFDNKGTLTITDNSAEANGVINARGNYNDGTLTLEKGTINAIDHNGGYGVQNRVGSKFTMNGGLIATTNENGDDPGDGYDATTVRVDSDAEFIMNGGNINNISNFTIGIENYGTTTINENAGEVKSVHTTVGNHGTMTINGGTFICDGLEGITAHALWATPGSTTTINGGTFNGKDNYNGFNVDASAGAVVEINGGNFESVHSGSLYGDGTITVKGGTFFDVVAENRLAPGYVCKPNADDTYGVFLGVAKIKDGAIYGTLQVAITAAQPGNTIYLLADITENVTVNKNLTIDGKPEGAEENNNYTGKMTGNKGITLTVMNVDFVNAGFEKPKAQNSTTGDYTFKNCTFDGRDNYPYAFSVRGAKTITIEDCTVKDYMYGFLYTPSATLNVNVKNVTVEDCPNYGVYFASGVTNTSIENLTVKNSGSGIVYNNTASREFTLKNCTFENVTTAINHAGDGTNTVKCNLSGENDFGTSALSQYATIVLKEADATLTAQEGLNVTPPDDDYFVEYKEGKYVLKAAIAKIDDVIYESLQEAIDAAENEDEIVVLQDINIANVELQKLEDSYDTYFLVEGKKVTINLNGKTISGEYTGSMLVGVFSTDKNGELTLTGNGTVDVTTNTKVYSLIVAYNNGSKITIKDGTYKLNKASDDLIYYGGYTDKEVIVEGGTFTLGNVGEGENGKPWIFNVLGAGDHHVYVTGGTFNADINRQHWSNEAVVAETHYTVNNGDGTYTVKDGAEAYVNTGMTTGPYFAPKNIGYATLEEALAKAQEFVDKNVTILKEVVTLDESLTIEAGKEIILDLKGNDINVANDQVNFNINGKLTLNDETGEGVFTSRNHFVNEGAEFIVNGGTVQNVETATGGSPINLNGGSVTINGGTVQAVNNANYAIGGIGGTLVINGGTVKGNWGAVNLASGNATIKDGTLEVTGTTGGHALYVAGDTEVTIEGGEFKPYNGGVASYALVLDEGNPTVNVSGGMFHKGWGCVIVYAGNLSLTGGTFGSNMVITNNSPSESADINTFCAEGFAAVNNGDGTWTVMPVQEQSLVAGWNWYSSYLNITKEDLLDALGTNGKSIVQNSTWSATYYGVHDGTDYGWGYEESYTFDVSKMYMIETSQTCELALSGNLVDASEITITLNPGWNWIGYPSNVEVKLEDALRNLTPNEGDIIKNKTNSFAEYYGSKWLDGTATGMIMEPTKGYMYHNSTNETKTFRYNIVPIRGNNERLADNHYVVDYTKYPFNMTMTAVVDGAIGDNYEVAALVNGEVRGSARPVYVEALDTYMLFLTISGDEVEEVSFKYYDITTEEEYELVNRINYSNNAMVGSVNEPYVLSRGTTGIGGAAMSNVNIYPNPTTTGTEINLEATCDKVEVFNALGVKVAEYQNVDTIDALETAGIYVIRITNNGNVQNCRLVVK